MVNQIVSLASLIIENICTWWLLLLVCVNEIRDNTF